MIKLPKEIDKATSDFILKSGLVREDQFREAVTLNEAISCGVSSALIDMGFINEEQIADSFCSTYGLSRSKIKISNLKTRPLTEKLSDQFVIKSRVVPIDSAGDKVFVVVADPSSMQLFNNIQLVSDMKLVEASVVTLSEMDEYIERLKSKQDGDFLRALEKSEDGGLSELDIEAATGGKQENSFSVDQLSGVKEEKRTTNFRINAGTDVIEFVDSILSNAITMGVSDIHMEGFREGAQVRYRKDGVLTAIEEFSEFLTYNYSACITRIKILASLDISERRMPQDGAITSGLADKTVDIRVSVLPTVHGERIVMRILDPEAANFTLDELGIPADSLAKLRKAIHSPQGLVLVTGPTGSGKSTTLYGCLKEMNKPDINILTAEDPVEYDLRGVGQVQVKESIGFTFASALRSFLRQDPEVIMVGEIRDKETADIAIKASLTGHLVLSTLHTNDAISTITRLMNIGVPNYLVTSSLSLVLAQRLSRVNCQHCLQDDPISRDSVLKDIGFTEEEMKTFKAQKSVGCERCNGTGIKGRAGVQEILAITPALKEAILNNATEAMLYEIAAKEGFQTMQDIGRKLIMAGKMSINEFKRVLVLD
jgi:type IV pilus assembly protein PilB